MGFVSILYITYKTHVVFIVSSTLPLAVQALKVSFQTQINLAFIDEQKNKQTK